MLNTLLNNPLATLLFGQGDEFMGIYDLSTERFVRVNPAGVQLLGFASEEALLTDPIRSRSLRMPPLSDDHRAHVIRQISQTGRHEETTRIGCQNGSAFWGTFSISAFRDGADALALVTLRASFDKTAAERQLLAQRDAIEQLNLDLEQKVADRTNALLKTLGQLERTKDRLTKALLAEQQAGELKSRFVSMASHEFRTPLTMLQTSATLIAKYLVLGQPDDCQLQLGHIQTSIRHLNEILDEFLSVDLIEAGRISAHPAWADVPKLLDETVVAIQGLLKPGQRIDIARPGVARPSVARSGFAATAPGQARPGHAWLDPSMLRKIMLNLLTNAVKYSGPGSVVSVRATLTEAELTIAVQDRGIGIPPAEQHHLFERFFRASNVSNVAGTGLGLHIVSRYVAMMDGRISLQSALNQGTTVTLLLPATPDKHPIGAKI